MRNNGKTAFIVKRGDRCAQLIIEKIYILNMEEVAVLHETVRGQKGMDPPGNHRSDKRARWREPCGGGHSIGPEDKR